MESDVKRKPKQERSIAFFTIRRSPMREQRLGRQEGFPAPGRSYCPLRPPPTTLQTASDVVALLGETINHVRRGELDLQVSSAIGYLSGILLSAIEKSSYEDRLAALEAAVANPPRTKSPFEEESIFDFVLQDPVAPEHPIA